MTLFELLKRIESLSLSLLTGSESLKKQDSLKAYNILPLSSKMCFNLRTEREFPELENQAYQPSIKKFQVFLRWEIWKNQMQALGSIALQRMENLVW